MRGRKARGPGSREVLCATRSALSMSGILRCIRLGYDEVYQVGIWVDGARADSDDAT